MGYEHKVVDAGISGNATVNLEEGVTAVIAEFDALFRHRYRTILVPGEGEPQYLPGEAGQLHRIEFAHGYFASALHEVAHWCIAGPLRRQQIDFGYWYEPDGRSAEQQREFEQVEVAPQALEWIFTRACGRAFRISSDNLVGDIGDTSGFAGAVHREVLRRLQVGLPVRARRFTDALLDRFSPGLTLHPGLFLLEDVT